MGTETSVHRSTDSHMNTKVNKYEGKITTRANQSPHCYWVGFPPYPLQAMLRSKAFHLKQAPENSLLAFKVWGKINLILLFSIHIKSSNSLGWKGPEDHLVPTPLPRGTYL